MEKRQALLPWWRRFWVWCSRSFRPSTCPERMKRSALKSRSRLPRQSKAVGGWEIAGAILAALLPVLIKVLAPKKEGSKLSEKLSQNKQAEDKFLSSGDTSDLGKLPD